MTEDIFPEFLLQKLGPKYIVPLTLYLAHEDCQETGSGIYSTIELKLISDIYSVFMDTPYARQKLYKVMFALMKYFTRFLHVFPSL